MQALYGEINLDGAAADSSGWRMESTCCVLRPASCGEWSEGPVLLGQQALDDKLISGSPARPAKGAGGQVVAVCCARLDNRSELCERLRIPDDGATTSETDGALLIEAYEVWGDECAAHLLGDWAFVLWDRSKRRLLLGRDYIGCASLY